MSLPPLASRSTRAAAPVPVRVLARCLMRSRSWGYAASIGSVSDGPRRKVPGALALSPLPVVLPVLRSTGLQLPVGWAPVRPVAPGVDEDRLMTQHDDWPWLKDFEPDLPLHRVPIPPPRHEVDIKPSTYQVRWGPFTRRPRGWWDVRCLQCHTFGGPMRRVDAEAWRDGHDTAVRQMKHWHTCAAEGERL